MKRFFKLMFAFVLGVMVIVPFMKVNATEGEKIGTTDATIKGTGYVFDVDNNKIVLDTDANVELTGNAGGTHIEVKENATNVTITLNNYTAVTGGWVNAINLKERSSAKVVLVGDNRLESGQEASAIRTLATTSLVIEGAGKLIAKVSNGGSAASSAVIGSQYDLNCGNITINGGTIITEFTGGGTISGIGTGDWRANEGEVQGTITVNGGNITTEVLGTAKQGGEINILGSGSAIIYTDALEGIIQDYNGIIFVTNMDAGEARGNATLTEDLEIPSNYSFTVAPLSSLTIPKDVKLTNKGTMLVLGDVMNNGTIENTGLFTNSGSINSNTAINGLIGNDIQPASYDFIEGTNQKFVIEEGTSLSFRINADYSKFADGGKVYVNETLLDEENYTSESGSTIITLKEAYMSTLTAGEYVIKVVFANNAVSTTSFTVENKVVEQSNEPTEDVKAGTEITTTTEEKTNNPKTFDNILLYVSMLVISAIGLYTAKKLFN